jgi:hypothetical protein
MVQITKFALLGVLLFSAAVSEATDQISGIWASVARTKGGLGSQWIFSPNGAVTYTFGAIVDFRYETKVDQLILTLVSPDGSPPPESSVQKFSVEGDKLTVDPHNAERRQVMSRTTKGDPNRPLVGEWTYEHYTGGPAQMRYSASGNAQLVVPMKTVTGTYAMENGVARVQLSGQPSALLARTDEKGSLTVRDDQGKEAVFRRFQY